MGKVLELYGSSWEALKIPEGFIFDDLKLAFNGNNTSFSADFNIVLKIINANGYRSTKPSTALILSIVIDCYKRHIACGGEDLDSGKTILKSALIAPYNNAVRTETTWMH